MLPSHWIFPASPAQQPGNEAETLLGVDTKFPVDFARPHHSNKREVNKPQASTVVHAPIIIMSFRRRGGQ